MWEDEANKRGGRWLINLEKKQRANELDRFWLDVVSIRFFFYMKLAPYEYGITKKFSSI